MAIFRLGILFLAILGLFSCNNGRLLDDSIEMNWMSVFCLGFGAGCWGGWDLDWVWSFLEERGLVEGRARTKEKNEEWSVCVWPFSSPPTQSHVSPVSIWNLQNAAVHGKK